MPFLAKFKKNWADEFNAHGFKVYKTEAEKDKDLLELERTSSCSFGSNEGWDDCKRGELTKAITVQEISQEELASFLRLFPGCDTYRAFGVYPEAFGGNIPDETNCIDFVEGEFPE